MKNKYLLSVIIPTYKRSENICRAIDSVLQQKGSFEIIVVDDNGKNSYFQKETEKKLIKYFGLNNFRYIVHDTNKNGAAARNTGIKFATGKYITFLDDDDEFINNRISEFEKKIKKEDLDYLFSGFIIKKNGKVEKRYLPKSLKPKSELQYDLLCQKSFFGTGSNIICKKDIINKINGFDEIFIRHQDMEFVIRVLDVAQNIGILENYSIVKNIDDNKNVPNYTKFFMVKNRYLEKFKYIINKYDKKKQKKIYKLNYIELVRNSIIMNNKADYKKSINFLKREKLYCLFDVFIIKTKLKLKSLRIIKIIRKI